MEIARPLFLLLVLCSVYGCTNAAKDQKINWAKRDAQIEREVIPKTKEALEYFKLEGAYTGDKPLVHKLYEQGATNIYMEFEAFLGRKLPVMLVIKLPDEKSERQDIIRVLNDHAEQYETEYFADAGQRYLTFKVSGESR